MAARGKSAETTTGADRWRPVQARLRVDDLIDAHRSAIEEIAGRFVATMLALHQVRHPALAFESIATAKKSASVFLKLVENHATAAKRNIEQTTELLRLELSSSGIRSRQLGPAAKQLSDEAKWGLTVVADCAAASRGAVRAALDSALQLANNAPEILFQARVKWQKDQTIKVNGVPIALRKSRIDEKGQEFVLVVFPIDKTVVPAVQPPPIKLNPAVSVGTVGGVKVRAFDSDGLLVNTPVNAKTKLSGYAKVFEVTGLGQNCKVSLRQVKYETQYTLVSGG